MFASVTGEESAQVAEALATMGSMYGQLCVDRVPDPITNVVTQENLEQNIAWKQLFDKAAGAYMPAMALFKKHNMEAQHKKSPSPLLSSPLRIFPFAGRTLS